MKNQCTICPHYGSPIKSFHYDQYAIYEQFLIFQANGDGMEVTHEDLIEAWEKAREKTRYKMDED